MLHSLKDSVQEYGQLGLALEKDNDPARMLYASCGFVDQGEWNDEFDWMMCTL